MINVFVNVFEGFVRRSTKPMFGDGGQVVRSVSGLRNDEVHEIQINITGEQLRRDGRGGSASR